MGASATLKRFAKSRDKALQLTGYLTEAHAKAISKIVKVAEHFSNRSEQVQLKAVNTVEAEIRLLLPHEQSRFSKLREQMIYLLELSQIHAQARPCIPTNADERSASTPQRNQGTQLRLI